MTAIATRLHDRLGDTAEIVPPDCLDPTWQLRLQAAFEAGEPFPTLVLPKTEASLAAAIALARAEQWPILMAGNGSKLRWGPPARHIPLLLSTQKLPDDLDHAVGDLVVTAAAGTTLAALQAALAPTGQFLPLDPAYPADATLGGIVATADAGSWRQRYGGPRDLLLGLSFVRADGAIAKAGGRVVKNVAGYDLMKLLTGSYGSLGAILQLTFRTYPLPPASMTALVSGPPDAIARARTALLQSALTPACVDLLSATVLQTLDCGSQPGLLARYQSIPASVSEQVQRLEQLLAPLGLTVQTTYVAEAETAFWTALRQTLSRAQPVPPSSRVCGKVGVRPSAAVELLTAVERLACQPSYAQIHASSGVGSLHLPADTDVAAIATLRRFCEAQQGYLTVLEAPLALKQQLEPWGYAGNAIAVMRQLKQQFDPSNLFSPGRFVGGI